MKKSKLKLENLAIESFKTQIGIESTQTIKGGRTANTCPSISGANTLLTCPATHVNCPTNMTCPSGVPGVC